MGKMNVLAWMRTVLRMFFFAEPAGYDDFIQGASVVRTFHLLKLRG